MKLLFVSLILCILVCSVINKPIFGNDEERKIDTTVVKSSRDSPRNVGLKKFNYERPNEERPSEERRNKWNSSTENNERNSNERNSSGENSNGENWNPGNSNENLNPGNEGNSNEGNWNPGNWNEGNNKEEHEEPEVWTTTEKAELSTSCEGQKPPSIKPVVPKTIGNIIFSSINHFW